ncbi:hypothetical protein [Halorubrum sp. DTA46]|uniref:hypothetical protein n=1 Tax=Halorubrum sp. DTA46 TaxID=3402162 RepID=UPI003AACD06A
MALDVTAGFDKLADQQFMMDAGGVAGGVLAGESLGYVIDGHTVFGFDTPAELGGVAVVAGAEYAPMIEGRTKRHLQVGGGVAILLSVMERFGVREALTGVLA